MISTITNSIQGDIICFVKDNQIESGKIYSISLKGTVRVQLYHADKKMFTGLIRNLKTVKIIKVTGIFPQT